MRTLLVCDLVREGEVNYKKADYLVHVTGVELEKHFAAMRKKNNKS